MKSIFSSVFLFVLLLISLRSFSQQGLVDFSFPISSDTIQGSRNTPSDSPTVSKKMTTQVAVGTSFSSFGKYGSAFNTFVAPTLSYPISKRFYISGGVILSNTTMMGIKPWYSSGQETGNSGNFSSALIHVSGNYLVNDHLTISGTLYKEINLFNNAPPNSPYYKNDFQGGYMKVDYRVFNNVHIEASFGVSKGGYDPFNAYHSGFGYGNFGSPNFNSPFGH